MNDYSKRPPQQDNRLERRRDDRPPCHGKKHDRAESSKNRDRKHGHENTIAVVERSQFRSTLNEEDLDRLLVWQNRLTYPGSNAQAITIKGNISSNALQTEQFLVCRVTSRYNHRFSDRTSIPRTKASPEILQPQFLQHRHIKDYKPVQKIITKPT